MEMMLWKMKALNLLIHAEQHYLLKEDIDKIISMIAYDQSMEIMIGSYLSAREGYKKDFPNEKYDFRNKSYHETSLFIFGLIEKKELHNKFFELHDYRNTYYHDYEYHIPSQEILDSIRNMAYLLCSELFRLEKVNLENYVYSEVSNSNRKYKPILDRSNDKIIDDNYSMIQIAGVNYLVSELLANTDPIFYNGLAGELKEIENV